MRLIGISGLKTSGKDTTYKAVAAALSEQNVRRVAFADKLKELSAIALGIEDDFIEAMDEAKEEWVFTIDNTRTLDHVMRITGRQYLQYIGQGARKVFQDAFWVDQILPYLNNNPHQHNLQTMYPGVDVLCVTDVRYPNEADRVHELGGEVWQIIRPGTESDGHSSEIPLEPEKVDLSIYNGYSIDVLYDVVANVLAGKAHPATGELPAGLAEPTKSGRIVFT